MRRLARMLPDAIEQTEVLRASRARRTLRRWEEVVGPELYARSRPDRFDKGTVWVAVQGSAWSQELRMIKDLILGRLRELSGEPTLFEDVRFGVRPIPDAEISAELPDTAVRADTSELTIRQIADRRRRLRADDAGTSS